MDGNAWVSILLILVSVGVAIALASSIGEALAKTRASSYKTMAATIVSRVNEAVVTEFRKAWRMSGRGSGEIEGAVLLCQDADGAISARSLGQTNQRRRFPIICDPTVIAIVHTHPNKSNAQPERADWEIADHLRIPVFTITNRGMYVYDPGKRKISKVQEGLNWLDSAKWISRVRAWQ
jgi:hypothetical protein